METVDIWDSGMANKVTITNLVRVSDSSFTAVISNPAFTPAWMVHSSATSATDWTKFNTDFNSKRTGVYLDWTFNARSLEAGYTGGAVADYAGNPGCVNCAATPFTYPSGSCTAIVAILPAGSPENFNSQYVFGFPSQIPITGFDDQFGAHWQSAARLTMPDPLWARPFKPDCNVSPYGTSEEDAFTWDEDSGMGISTYTNDSGKITNYFAHHPLVEATTDSTGLPSGIYALYDLAHNAIAPPYYRTTPDGITTRGIPCGGGVGDYSNVEMDWGVALRMCNAISAPRAGYGPFYATFVTCP